MNPPTNPPPGEHPAPNLCDADMRVLDFLAEHGFDASRVHLLPEADRPRAMALIRQMQVLDAYPADATDDTLVNATLARIDRYEAAAEASRRVDTRAGAFRLSDFVSIAALVLVGVGVTLPIAARVREDRMTTGCQQSLRGLYEGMGAYAGSNAGALPAAASIADIGSLFRPSPAAPRATGYLPEAGPRPVAPPSRMQNPTAGATRIVIQMPGAVVRITTVAQDWSAANHGAHLALLAAQGYCATDALRCPACAASGAPCFAYRVPTRGDRFTFDLPSSAVLAADANPLVASMRRGAAPPPRTANSANHQGTGQNILFGDGAFDWRNSPILTSPPAGAIDNIWLPRDERGLERSDLRAWPSHPADNFVAQ
jgi:hypothetical protein